MVGGGRKFEMLKSSQLFKQTAAKSVEATTGGTDKDLGFILRFANVVEEKFDSLNRVRNFNSRVAFDKHYTKGFCGRMGQHLAIVVVLFSFHDLCISRH